MIWVLAIVCATPDAILSDAVPRILNNVTNRSIYYCTPFGAEEPFPDYRK